MLAERALQALLPSRTFWVLAWQPLFRCSAVTKRVRTLFNDYWEDIGTMRSFFDANLALTQDPLQHCRFRALRSRHQEERAAGPPLLEGI